MSGRRLQAVCVVILGFVLAPIVVVVPASFSPTPFLVFPPVGISLRWYANFLESRELMASLWLSLRLASAVTVVAAVLGTMAAVALVRYRVPGRDLVRSCAMAPVVLPGVVLGLGLLLLFSRLRLNLGFWGLLLAHLLVTVPYVLRSVAGTLEGVGISLEEAAASLGADPATVFRTITLPLVKPGIIAGAIFAFITSFDELVISMFLSGPRLATLPVQILNYIEFTSDPTIAAISVILIVLTTLAVLGIERAVGLGRMV